jgi:hypothetical protein
MNEPESVDYEVLEEETELDNGADQETEEIEEPEPKEPEVTKGAQKRIDELTRQKHDERRRADKLADELDKLRAEQQRQPERTTPTGAPDPEKYAAGRYDPDYLEARQDWLIEQRFNREQKAREDNQKQGTIAQLESAVAEKYKDYSSAKTDFLSHDLAKVPAFMELLRDSDNPAELAYYLGKNPDEMDRLGELTPAQANRYIGKLEARFTSDTPTQATKKASAAPKPITPVGAFSGSNATKSPDDMTMDEYAAWSKKKAAR